jgi:hypothetical protein
LGLSEQATQQALERLASALESRWILAVVLDDIIVAIKLRNDAKAKARARVSRATSALKEIVSKRRLCPTPKEARGLDVLQARWEWGRHAHKRAPRLFDLVDDHVLVLFVGLARQRLRKELRVAARKAKAPRRPGGVKDTVAEGSR